MPRGMRSGGQRLFAFATLLAACSAILWLLPLRDASAPRAGLTLPWWAALAACLAASLLMVEVRILRSSVRIALGEAGLAFALLGLEPHLLLGLYAGSVLVAHVVRRGPHPVKDYSNLMLDSLVVAVAVLVLRAVGTGGGPLMAHSLFAVVAAMAAAGATTTLAVTAGTVLYQGRLLPDDAARLQLVQVVTTTLGTSLGLIALALLTVQPLLLALLLPPFAAAVLVERAAAAGAHRAGRIEFLYAASEALHAAKPVDERAGDVLCSLKAAFSMARAELVLVPEARDAALRFVTSDGVSAASTVRSDLSYAEQEVLNALRTQRLMSGRQAGSPMSPLDLLLAERNVSAGAVVSLRGTERPQGMLLLLEPVAGDVELSGNDARLLSDVAQHITAALENGQLAGALRSMTRERDERARHSMYDPLTQIANRSLFDESVTRALARLGTSRKPVALLCVDLDGFAAVNERHGRPTGDEVLSAVAARLRTQIRRFDLVARLGGDEFGILLDGVRRRDDVHIVARRIVATLREPLRLENFTVSLSGSVGVAVVDEPATAPPVEELLRRADMAMYLAKRQGKDRYVVFDTGARTSVIAAAVQRPAHPVGA